MNTSSALDPQSFPAVFTPAFRVWLNPRLMKDTTVPSSSHQAWVSSVTVKLARTTVLPPEPTYGQETEG